MGCCLSTPKPTPLPLSTQQDFSKSPPRPEEESVKEVLSETPKPAPGFLNLTPEEDKPPTKSKIHLTRPDPEVEISDSVSVSLSESVSNTTPHEREEEEASNLNHHQWSGGQIRYRSPGQIGNNNRSLSAGRRSPSKRAGEPGRNPVQRREAGENSGRRSRSPGNRANVGRSPSGRRNGPSPGRVRMVSGQRKVEESESEWQGPNESLENPLVSLECFIFL